MIMARRGSSSSSLVVVVVVVALAALLVCVASAAGGKPLKAPAAGRRPLPPRNSKFVTLTPKTFGHKRNYQVSCSDEGGPACYVGCPKECPNKCLVFCAYCLSFCST